MKEAHPLLGWRCCESDQRGVEVLQHLPPLVIDGAMTFIRDDKVEGLNRDRRVIADRLSGVWKQNTGRLLASGSRRFVKRVSTPVDW